MVEELKEHFPQSKFAPEVKADGKCYCPQIDEREIIGNKHKVCGGIVDISRIKIKKVKGGKKK